MTTEHAVKKKITYVCPRVPTPEALETCRRLMADMPELEFQGIDTLQDLFSLMSDPNWQADFAVIDIEECHRLDGINMWELVSSLSTLNKLQVKTNGKRPIALIAGISDTAPVDLVREAMTCGDFCCLNPIVGGRWTYDICLDSVRLYSNWDWTLPQCIAEMIALEIDPRPIHLYFNRLIPEGYISRVKDDLLRLERRVIPCASWDELPEKLKLRPRSICFHANELDHSSTIEIVNMLRTMNQLAGGDPNITVTVGLTRDIDYSTIKILQKSQILGLVPTWADFGIDETVRGLRAQWIGESYWPRHIIEQLPGFAKKKPKKQTSSELVLTTRQQQIFDLIVTRGASNKHIAKTLHISESTVKLHMSAILKKYGCQNRTQLTVFSQRQQRQKAA